MKISEIKPGQDIRITGGILEGFLGTVSEVHMDTEKIVVAISVGGHLLFHTVDAKDCE